MLKSKITFKSLNKIKGTYGVITLFLLIIQLNNFSFGYSDNKFYALDTDDSTETVYLADSSLTNPIKYIARDSMIANIVRKRMYLYGAAEVYYEDMELKADYIEIDLEKKEVLATYTLDSLGQPIGRPFFKQGGEEFDAASILYNFQTKKGLIKDVKTQQGEGYLHMDVSKRHPNEEVHLKNGRFTTCDLDNPHFHFNLTKAVVVPNKRIVTGPVNMWIAGVPTPIGLPFGYFPNTPKKEHGLLFPEIVPFSPNGFGLQNLGYYIPLGEFWETTFYGTILSRGSWGLKNVTRYKKRYKSTGFFELGFQQTRGNFPEKNVTNQLNVRWQHTQDIKAHPTWRFGANVEFFSDNNVQNNIQPDFTQYFNNQFNSNITLAKTFKGTPLSLSGKVGLRQNTNTGNFIIEAPSFTFNVARYYLPFGKLKKVQGGKKKWYEKIGITYNLNMINRATINDSLFSPEYNHLIGRQFVNGINHRATLATTLKIFKGTVNWTPFNVVYNGRLNFQSIEKRWDNAAQELVIDTVGTGYSHDLSYTTTMSTVLYGKYAFRGPKRTVVKHNMTPSIGFRYSPDLSSTRTGFVGSNGTYGTYSPFERSAYRESITRETGSLNYSLGNVIQVKYRKPGQDKDTIIQIFEALDIRGSYDFFKDSMQLSDFYLTARAKPTKWLNITASATFSPYGWIDSTKAPVKEFATKVNDKLGRFTAFSLFANVNLTSKDSYDKIIDAPTYGPNWDADFNYFYNHSNEIIDFSVPWKIGLSYNVTYGLSFDGTQGRYVDKVVQSSRLNAMVRITKRWRIIGNATYDYTQKKITQMNFQLQRDMHCWQLTFDWRPIGGQQSFLLKFNVKASMLSDLKYEFRKPPEIF